MTSSSDVGAVVSFSLSPGCQVIDSIMALFRVDFSGRGELAERQQKLAQMLSRLQKISEGVIMCRIIWHKHYGIKLHNVQNHGNVLRVDRVCPCPFRVQCCSVYHQPDDS